jgi:hypothetical protein
VQKKEFKTLAIGAFIIMLVSTLITASVFYLDVSIMGLGDDDNETPYSNFLLGQALAPCEKAIAGNIKGDILNQTYDALSSRYDADRNAYLVFYSLDNRSVYGDKRSFHIVCTVSASTNRLRDFEIVTATETTIH